MRSVVIGFLVAGTIVAGCNQDHTPSPDPKLDFYIDSFQASDGTYQPSSRVSYEYGADGKLTRSVVGGFNASTKAYEDQQVISFSYQGNTLSKIENTLAGSTTPSDTYTYSYGTDSRVSMISEDNKNTQLTSTATFIYNSKNDSVRVVYAYSNGQGFEYAFRYNTNILADKTTKGSQLCSNGSYTYDQHSSPFSKLGYIDYFLNNMSANNKITEELNYINCAFPVLVPVLHSYQYTTAGLPSLVITSYQGTTKKSQRQFFYK